MISDAEVEAYTQSLYDNHADNDYINNAFDMMDNNDLEKYKKFVRKLYANALKEHGNNDLKTRFYAKLLDLIEKEQSKKPHSPQRSPPPIVRATRGRRHSRTPSPISRLGQNSPPRIFRSRGVRPSSASPTTFDGRVRSSGGKRTRKYKSRKHKSRKHKSRKHKSRKHKRSKHKRSKHKKA